MARLVFYSHTASVSGAEVVLLSILRGLDRNRFMPVVLCPEGALSLACTTEQVEWVAVPEVKARFTRNPIRLCGYLWSLAASTLFIRRVLRRQKPDLVHANTLRAGLVASMATLGMGVPVLWHIHDILPSHAFTTLIRGMAKRLNMISLLAVSQATAKSFRGTGKKALNKPVEVVYNSVDVDRYFPDAVARERMRRELGLREDQIAVGVVGQITPRKGLIELVEAFAQIYARMPQAVLVLVGEALFNEANLVYARQIRERVEQLDLTRQVWLVGAKKDIAAVMNAVDLLAQNSLVEPLGLALMEGFACGRTAAATGVDGVLEIIDDGRTGLLAPLGDTAELARKIEVLINQPELRARMGEAARQKMIEGFTPAQQMRQMHSLYERLVRPANRAKTERPQ